MTGDLRERKLVEVVELRKQADAAKAIGASVGNLAPVVAQELEALVRLQANSGVLIAVWARAREAAAKNETLGEDAQMVAALAAVLMAHSRAAGKFVMEHGEQLREKGATLIGKADAIEELVTAMPEQQEEVIVC